MLLSGSPRSAHMRLVFQAVLCLFHIIAVFIWLDCLVASGCRLAIQVQLIVIGLLFVTLRDSVGGGCLLGSHSKRILAAYLDCRLVDVANVHLADCGGCRLSCEISF